jgi:predicted phosphodiesterase
VCANLDRRQRLTLEKNKRLNGILTGCIVFATFSLIANSSTPLPSRHNSKNSPSYAGFSEIDPSKKHFILVGDTQSTSHWEFWRERNDKERKLIIDEIARREPAFVVHLGDLTTRGSSQKHWQQFDDLHKALRERNIPYFPILGNHEFYGNDEKALDYYFGRFPHLEKKRWYSFTWKNIGLILLDSNFSTLTKEQIETQTRWYLGELERFEQDKSINYVIVCCHEPPFTNSRVVAPNEKTKMYFADPFIRFSKACLFFSGHSHTYERFQIEGKSFVVSGGGGGPRHKVTVDPQKRHYNDLFPGPELRFFHFCQIETKGQGLELRILRLEPDESFTVADSLTIWK